MLSILVLGAVAVLFWPAVAGAKLLKQRDTLIDLLVEGYNLIEGTPWLNFEEYTAASKAWRERVREALKGETDGHE